MGVAQTPYRPCSAPEHHSTPQSARACAVLAVMAELLVVLAGLLVVLAGILVVLAGLLVVLAGLLVVLAGLLVILAGLLVVLAGLLFVAQITHSCSQGLCCALCNAEHWLQRNSLTHWHT